MCIRDRLAAVPVIYTNVHFCAAVLTEKQAGQRVDFPVPVGAVSYTHLDVYKRQGYPKSSFTFAEMARPSARPASFLEATPITLPYLYRL